MPACLPPLPPGKYELVSVLTHKGRSADSGHYTAWVKQADGKWVLFDDDTLSFKTGDEILALSGGGGLAHGVPAAVPRDHSPPRGHGHTRCTHTGILVAL